MTKEEIYNELVNLGCKPAKAVRFCKIEELETALALAQQNNSGNSNPLSPGTEQNPGNGQQSTEQNQPSTSTDASTDADVKKKETVKTKALPTVIPTLFFAQSGWCEKLKTSYFNGYYQPRTQAEYEALKPFAAKPR